MGKINGFYCHLESKGGKLLFDLENDGVSVQNYDDGSIFIIVQTSLKNRNQADQLAKEYKKNQKDFTPSREIAGSFIIIDKHNNVVFAGRDRNQASHLYALKKDNELFLSTDIRTFLDKCKTLDAAALDMAIMNGIVVAPLPLIKGIKAILPGRYVLYDCALVEKDGIFWRINKTEVPTDYLEAVHRYGQLLMDSISANVGNDTAAVFLSGGSDSAAVMGALNKLGVSNVYAAHMKIDGHFDFEHDDVSLLHDKYKFNLKYITPSIDNVAEWEKYINSAMLRGSLNSVYASFPVYQLMGEYFASVVPDGATVFNGEMCILDQGFNESGDSTRSIRRWLFAKQGRLLGYTLKIAPNFINVNWDVRRKPFFIRDSWRDKLFVFDKLFRSTIHSIGRPEEYFAGIKLGYMGFPGYFLGLSLLPIGYTSCIKQRCDDFFRFFVNELCSKDWKTAMAMLSTCWYSESSNFTMANDTASLGNLSMCFPFSSPELMDFAASLPSEWAIDKKIQKDACKLVYDMPNQVAYRMKNHTEKNFSYFNTFYGAMKEHMINTILNTDFGPLNDNIHLLLEHKLVDTQILSLYGYSLWIRQYNLRVE